MPALHHLALGARNVENIANFYHNFFGLEKIKTHKDEQGLLRSIWLDMGPGILMIEKSEHPDSNLASMQLGKGPFLLAFRIQDKEKEAFLTKLRDEGLKIEGQTNFTIYFRDPEDNRVAISWYELP